MTHNEKRASPIKEGLIGLASGIGFGVTSVVVGHPLDTIKTKMQAQPGYEKLSMIGAFKKTVMTDGIRGLYRGVVPPLFGSGAYRSIQFAVFESCYTALNTPFGTTKVVGGTEVRIFAGAFVAATARSCIEGPLELAKVRRQTLQNWNISELGRGFGITWVRTMGLMTTYFIIVDYVRRKDLFQSYPVIAPFLTSGSASTLGWIVVWPLERVKSQVQQSTATGRDEPSVIQRIRLVVHLSGGIRGLYRGLLPGVMRSFFANGLSMVVMQRLQREASKMGFRGPQREVEVEPVAKK